MTPQKDREQATVAPDSRPDAEQPRWRQDFPIDWPHDHYVARRDFTKFLVLTSFAFAVGQVWIVIENLLRSRRGDTPLRLVARVDEVPVGGAFTFTYPEPHDQCVLVRLGENDFVAFSRQCTHLSCSVVPQLEKHRLYCPCHEGAFDASTGNPVAGPPRRPLARIKLEFRQAAIYASGVELRTTN
ncbi:MAG TPA: Rieske 2Fe-2S domain-containing protein [Blastocatellia bacterium]|nr:Rieske 2Fe-2S domain-containing protein [Blastocatellia bacterium]